MRRINNYSISKESTEDMIKAGRFNPCLQITFRDKTGKHTHTLSAGYSDVLDVYREGTETFIFSTNFRLGYIGLEIFEGAEKAGDIFLEGYQMKEVLGRDDLTPLTIIRRLKNYIYSRD